MFISYISELKSFFFYFKKVAFEATVRAVNKGGCQINLRGIIVIKFDTNVNNKKKFDNFSKMISSLF
jgi:hypothetical protein